MSTKSIVSGCSLYKKREEGTLFVLFWLDVCNKKCTKTCNSGNELKNTSKRAYKTINNCVNQRWNKSEATLGGFHIKFLKIKLWSCSNTWNNKCYLVTFSIKDNWCLGLIMQIQPLLPPHQTLPPPRLLHPGTAGTLTPSHSCWILPQWTPSRPCPRQCTNGGKPYAGT